jgi:hypothetical protein
MRRQRKFTAGLIRNRPPKTTSAWAYVRLPIGDRAENLKRAKAYFESALRVYTQYGLSGTTRIGKLATVMLEATLTETGIESSSSLFLCSAFRWSLAGLAANELGPCRSNALNIIVEKTNLVIFHDKWRSISTVFGVLGRRLEHRKVAAYKLAGASTPE